MPEDIGDTILEVLEVGASFQAGDEPSHKHSSKLGLRSGGAPLWVSCDVEGVLFFPVENCGAESTFLDTALHS